MMSEYWLSLPSRSIPASPLNYLFGAEKLRQLLYGHFAPPNTAAFQLSLAPDLEQKARIRLDSGLEHGLKCALIPIASEALSSVRILWNVVPVPQWGLPGSNSDIRSRKIATHGRHRSTSRLWVVFRQWEVLSTREMALRSTPCCRSQPRRDSFAAQTIVLRCGCNELLFLRLARSRRISRANQWALSSRTKCGRKAGLKSAPGGLERREVRLLAPTYLRCATMLSLRPSRSLSVPLSICRSVFLFCSSQLPPFPTKVWWVGQAGRSLRLGAQLASDAAGMRALAHRADKVAQWNQHESVRPFDFSVVGSFVEDPLYEMSLRYDSESHSLTGSYVHQLTMRRRVLNVFEEANVKGIYNYVDLGLQYSQPLPRADAGGADVETAAPSIAVGASWQPNKVRKEDAGEEWEGGGR